MQIKEVENIISVINNTRDMATLINLIIFANTRIFEDVYLKYRLKKETLSKLLFHMSLNSLG